MNEKELCDCGAVAVWDYMPGYSNMGNTYHCDDCVPRGCDCNDRHVDINAYHPPLDNPDLPTQEDGHEGVDWEWVEKDKVWRHIDEKGRPYPCCEYTYDKDGFEKD